jgi:hypothetical protein
MADLCGPNNQALREALDAPDGFPISRHREYIERVRLVHPHTVVFRQAIGLSTCVLHALGLSDEPVYRAIALNFDGRVFAGRAFMQWLINGHLVEIDKPTDGSLALYFNQGVWQHVGIVSGDRRVTSQWGMFPVYDHDVWESPARYGDEVRYFSMLVPGEPLRLFLEFAKTQGISDSDVARVAGVRR